MPEPRLAAFRAQLEAIDQRFCGYTLREMPTARLTEVAFSAKDCEAVQGADLLIFPSPFAVESSLARALVLFADRQQPWIAVVGQGSYQAVTQSGLVADLTRVVLPLTPPFDAEHLAPLIVEMFAGNFKGSSERRKVILFSAANGSVGVRQWQQWLQHSCLVTSVKSYSSIPIPVDAADFVNHSGECFFYCTSSSSIAAVAAVFARRSTQFETFTAVTIHPNISREVKKRLGWRVIEIEPGAQALINCLKVQKNE
jgi:uroporphyrinogen-III synthase